METDSIESISKVYITASANKTFAFNIFLKNRVIQLEYSWTLRMYNGETDDSLEQKVIGIRDRLARSITPNIENLDAIIDLKKYVTTVLKPQIATATFAVSGYRKYN